MSYVPFRKENEPRIPLAVIQPISSPPDTPRLATPRTSPLIFPDARPLEKGDDWRDISDIDI